jgi:hypothetical protein
MHENKAVKLTDFGIAQLVDMQGMTTTGQVLGSPAHMAPEQIEGKDCDARSDLFSLGTVLYLLATGELPFQGRNAHQVLKQIMDGQFRDPLRVKAQIGGRLRSVIMRCLQVDPTQRYTSARELEDDLMQFVRAAGIDNPGEVIARYLKGTRAFSLQFRARIVEAEMALGEQAMKAGDVPHAMDAFNRVLSIDERNERVLRLVRNLGKREKIRRASYWVMLVLSLTCVTGVLVHALAGRPPNAQRANTVARAHVPAAPDPSKPTTASPAATAVTPQPPTAADLRPSSEATRPRPEHRANAPRASSARPDEPSYDLNVPRHVVLRPEPANVSISIDGAEAREFGPSFRDVSLAPGVHTFVFKGAHECCVDEQISVDVPPGNGTYVVSHRLRYRPAGLYVFSNTPANVQVDRGAAVGRTYSLIQVQQPNDMFAPHVVRVSAEGHTDSVQEVRLRAGQVNEIRVQLEKLPDVPPPGPVAPSPSASSLPSSASGTP